MKKKWIVWSIVAAVAERVSSAIVKCFIRQNV